MSRTPPVLDRKILKSPRPYAGQRWSKRGDPVWELAMMHPPQGEWTEAEYLQLEQEHMRVELVDGCLEFLPMPTLRHQRIALFLCGLLNAFFEASRQDREAATAPCPIRLWPRHLREPDVFVLESPDQVDPDRPPDSAVLTIEIVSRGAENRQRDLIDKRADYARAGVKEYWIVDPERKSIMVLALGKKRYRVHGEFKSGDTANSVLLEGFSVPVASVFASGQGTSG